MTNLNIINAIAAARNTNNSVQVEKQAINEWWGTLCLAWDTFRAMDKDTKGSDAYNLGKLWGSGIAHEMTGNDWINLHCDTELWDMETKDSTLRELCTIANRLTRGANQYGTDTMKDAASTLTSAVVGRGKCVVEDMNKYDGAKRYDDRQKELSSDYMSQWERSKMLFEYVAEKVEEWDAVQTLKYINMIDKRNKLNKKDDYRLLFPFYIASGVLLHAKMAEVGYGKLQNKSKGLLNWFLEKYDHHDVECQVASDEEDKVVRYGFDENMDSDEEAGEGVCFSPYASADSWASVIDYKARVLAEADVYGCSPEDIMVADEELRYSWL